MPNFYHFNRKKISMPQAERSETKYQAPAVIRTMAEFNRYLSRDFLGGPKKIPLAWVINFQKGGTLLFVLGLMWYFNNYATEAWVYLALHGSYGLCWLLKDLAFPDKSWMEKVTLGGAIMSFLLVLGPYWVFPFLLISGVQGPSQPEASGFLIFLVTFLYVLGVVIMIASDAQKYFTLKYRKGLITEGMHRYIRHPNYLGEMLVYGAFALLVQHWIPWAILGYIWICLFLVNMLMKEASMSRYPEWQAYKRRTGMLLPKFW
jgi:protein-S-isoprenylcysteine O-methyltransferase Ste14